MKVVSRIKTLGTALLLLLVFLQPNISCNNKKAGGGPTAGGNPIYAKDPDAGIQWTASAPDEVLASDV